MECQFACRAVVKCADAARANDEADLLAAGKEKSTTSEGDQHDHDHDDDVDDDNAHHAYADAGEAQCRGKTGNSRKLARVRKLVALHQNSTLNKEGKRNHGDGDELGNFVLLRKFLQNPTETKEDQSTLCVKFIIATLREVQQLMADELPAFLAWALHSGGGDGDGDGDEERRVVEEATRQIREHPLLQYALHFQIGLYALYAAQVLALRLVVPRVVSWVSGRLRTVSCRVLTERVHR